MNFFLKNYSFKRQGIAGLFFALFLVVAMRGTAQTVAQFSGPARLKQLEMKAEDRDFYAKRAKDMEMRLSEAEMVISNMTRQLESQRPQEAARRIQELERKALAYDAIVQSVEKKDGTLVSVSTKLSEAERINNELRQKVDEVEKKVAELEAETKRLKEVEQGLRNTITQMMLGNFEYYEVKEGDTLPSIAARPTIYGDASKAIWLKQANKSWIEDFDLLEPGEVLIVPRFPPAGRYEF
jgi:myosin heavy subunit